MASTVFSACSWSACCNSANPPRASMFGTGILATTINLVASLSSRQLGAGARPAVHLSSLHRGRRGHDQPWFPSGGGCPCVDVTY